MAKIAEVLKYEGDNSTFIWKHPSEDFNSLTQLIVHESQEAIFFLNGQALDLFGAGRYTLTTQNIPLVGKLLNKVTDDESPFHCEVYFINRAEQMAIRWGTDTRVEYMEPTYQFPLSVGASGEMSLSVADSRRLLLKLVGTERSLDRAKLVSFFRGILMSRVKSYIAQMMRTGKISIFEIDERMEQFSEELREKLCEDFLEYGITLNRFFVTTIAKPDGEPQYEKFKELHFRQYADIAEAKLQQQVGIIEEQTEAQRRVIEAQSIAQKRSLEGYTYQQERGFDVAEKVAQNEGAGEFTSAGVGLGMMAGIGGAVGGTVGGVFQGAMAAVAGAEPAGRFCEECGAALAPGAAFCENCGAKLQSAGNCVRCGYQFTKPGNFCPKCGMKRED